MTKEGAKEEEIEMDVGAGRSKEEAAILEEEGIDEGTGRKKGGGCSIGGEIDW